MKLSRSGIFFLALFLQFHTSFAETFDIVGVELPGLLNGSTTEPGPYDRVVQAIADDSGLQIRLVVRPLARAFREYNGGQYEGIFPATVPIVERPSLESRVVNRVKVFLFSHPDSPPIKSINALAGRNVGRVRGMAYPELIMNAPGSVQLTRDETQNVKMLLAKRIDAFFGTVPDLYLAMQKIEPPSALSVDASIYYMNNSDAFLLADTPENRLRLNRLNASIAKLSQNGMLRELLGIAYVE